jgi:diacylglycerol kinase family enzyme
MRIALIHNSFSGRRVALETLRTLLEAEGHQIVRVVDHTADTSQLAAPPAELVVAAGGDGTVGDAVRAIAGRGVPLAVLPLGTANNIAFTLGLTQPLEQLARSWHGGLARPLDIGELQTPDGPRQFVEGVGGGLVEACMASFRRQPLHRGEPPPWQLVRALRRYLQTLPRLQTRRWWYSVDGEPRTGDFLLVEVMNARAVGPNLEFAPDASASDGLLTVVTASESDRPALSAYFKDRLAGRDAVLRLTTETARAVDLHDPQTLHVDDELVRLSAGSQVSMRVDAGAVTVLVPPRS